MAMTSTTTPNFLGELFMTGKRPNHLLRLLGGIQNGIKETKSKEFPTGVFYNIASPSQPANLEGANAPSPNTVSLSQASNVVQIFHETITVSYMAQSDKTVSGIVPIPQGTANGMVQSGRSRATQTKAAIEKVQQDLNYSLLRGVWADPTDPTTTALKTRGIFTAISTNGIDNSGTAAGAVTAAIYRGWVDTLLLQMIASNGYSLDETFVCFVGATEFSNMCHAYGAAATQFVLPEATVFGVRVRTVATSFGTLNLVLEPDMPNQYVAVFNLAVAGIVGMAVEGKGFFFEEDLAKTGSADQAQLYGQFGIDHGPEYLHGYFKVASGIAL